MKKLTIFILLGCYHCASAQANSCIDTDPNYVRVNDRSEIVALLDGKRVEAKAPASAPSPDEEWNEDHCSSGALYKVGVSVNDPVDPRAYRGIWGIFTVGSPPNETSAIQYVYSQPNTFFWSLWKNSAGDLCWERVSDFRAIAVDPAPLPGPIDSGLDCSITPPSP